MRLYLVLECYQSFLFPILVVWSTHSQHLYNNNYRLFIAPHLIRTCTMMLSWQSHELLGEVQKRVAFLHYYLHNVVHQVITVLNAYLWRLSRSARLSPRLGVTSLRSVMYLRSFASLRRLLRSSSSCCSCLRISSSCRDLHASTEKTHKPSSSFFCTQAVWLWGFTNI